MCHLESKVQHTGKELQMTTDQCTKMKEPNQGGRTCPGSAWQVWGRGERGFSKLLSIYQLHFPQNYCSLGSLVLREERARGNMEVLDHNRALTSNKGLIPKGTNNRGKGCRGDCKGDRRGMFKKAFLPPQC